MRKSIGIAAAAAVTLALVVAAPFTQAASALSPGVSFSAADLPTWQVNNEVYALGQSKGKVLVGGSFTRLSPPTGASGTPLTVTGLGVLNAETGNPDSCQFPVTLSGGTPTIRAITPAADGNTLFVGGSFSTIGGVNVNRIAQLDLSTCKVLPFHPLGGAINGAVYAIAVKANTVYIGGAMTAVGTSTRQHFAALNATTGALLPWVADTDLTGRAITVSPDGTKVAIGGDFFTVNGADSHSIGVVDATTGANLANYPMPFIAQTSVTKALTSDGTSFYGGNEGTGGGVFDGVFAVDWNTLQQRWRDTCLGATQALLVYKSTLYEATHHHDCSSMNQQQDGTRMYFNASSTDTPYLLGWNPRGNDGINEGIGPRANVVATGATTGKDYLWYGGEFTQINGHAQQGLTRFGPDDTTTPPTPSASAEALTPNAIQVRLRTVVDPDDSLLTYSIYRNGGTTPVWTGQASSLWWTRPQVTWTDTNVTPGTTYTYRVTANDGTNTSPLSAAASAKATGTGSAYAAAVLGDSPNLFWRYDETSGTWLQDKSGNTTAGLNGTYENGAIGGAAGAIKNDPSTAATFNGSSSQYAWSDEMIQGPKVYSVETWFKTTTTTGGKIVGFGNGRPETNSDAPNLSSNYDRQIYMTNGGQLVFGAYNGGTATIQSSSAYNDGQWHQAVGTQGPGGMTFYVDGVKVGQNTVSGNQDYVGTWRVGYDSLNGWPSQPSANYFTGSIDDTAVYPSVLSPTQVINHYTTAGYTPNVQAAPADNYGKAVYNDNPDMYWRLDESSGTTAADSSLYAQHPATYSPDVQLGQPGVLAGHTAVTLPGTSNGTISEAQPQGSTGAFSSELWFRTTSTTGGKLVGFEDTQTGNGSNYDKQVYMTDSGQLLFGVWVGYVASVTSPASYNDGNWHQLVATQGAAGMALYVDGALVGSNGETSNQSFTGYWRLGGGNIGGWPSSPSNFYFTGSIDEAAIYPTQLSAAQVSAHYGLGTSDTTPPTVPSGVAVANAGGAPQVSWTASTDNVGVASYSVYRGTTAGFTPGAGNQVATGVTTTSYTDAAGLVGTYYYKVVALDGAGNASAPSSAASITLSDTTPPTAPTGVAASLSGSTVSLSWTAATDNVGVTAYQVHRSTTSGFTPDGSTLIGTVSSTSATDTLPGMGTYYYRIVAVDAAGNSGAPSDQATATLGDTTPPSVPSGLSATASGSTVALSWTASTDNVGVTGYTVYRSTTSGFAPSAATQIGTTAGASYTDSGVANGTYYYVVTATDGTNTSGPSAQASATVAVTAVTVTSSVNSTQDAMVAASVPTTNYGTYNQLSARGGSGASPIQSFLTFALPAAPAGYTLTGATLQVRTSGDATAGTTNAVLFNLLSGAWDQSTVNWNTRPTGIGAALGTLTGATAVNTPYTATLDASQLAPLLGTSTSIAMTMAAADTDNLRIYSYDNSASLRPVLQLTFTKS
ncbi:LamG-like jellyroll fold domain-containing protein [Leifsonia aquatica]|uniref:Fibronectin type 3 domain-containing protein n=1 Tax=Leifsonia aquatica TaxID=144185 RepID=A0A7W4UYD1_LEIAQ|nr:LamG-like jellyroll fold domain-containing protein [Leifsonia aquatica]MBB2968565.1 fibronectin type 3 domain-containing protein [Leifsonia aquatica]